MEEIEQAIIQLINRLDSIERKINSLEQPSNKVVVSDMEIESTESLDNVCKKFDKMIEWRSKLNKNDKPNGMVG